jgi:hypothetical protein
MYSRFVFRSFQNSTPSLIFNRFLSLTQVQFAAVTKLKEKTPVATDEKSASNVNTEIRATKTIDTSVNENKSIPPPTSGLNDPNKTYSQNIHRLVEEISKLSLIDVMDLNELLKVNFQIGLFTLCCCCFIENTQDSRRANNGIWWRQ